MLRGACQTLAYPLETAKSDVCARPTTGGALPDDGHQRLVGGKRDAVGRDTHLRGGGARGGPSDDLCCDL
jgi:hypothetical protein